MNINFIRNLIKRREVDIDIKKIVNSITVSISTGNFEIARWEDVNGDLIKGEPSLYNKSQATLTPPSTNCILKICVKNVMLVHQFIMLVEKYK